MGKSSRGRGSAEATGSVSRRAFLSRGAAGMGAVALAGAPDARAQTPIKWDLSADVVVIGAGVSGLAAAITGRDHGVSVISVDENFDIGGRGMLSGGRVHLGGGHALQQKAGLRTRPTRFSKTGSGSMPRSQSTATGIWCGCSPTRTWRPSIS